jgi:hypothetical protein
VNEPAHGRQGPKEAKGCDALIIGETVLIAIVVHEEFINPVLPIKWIYSVNEEGAQN